MSTIIGDKRPNRKSEIEGKVQKARLTVPSGTYATGEQYDKLIKDKKLLGKFISNREFVDGLVGTTGLVNLVTPFLFSCFLCKEEIILDKFGSLSDYKKHLNRHKTTSKDVDIRKGAAMLLVRWEEIEAKCLPEDMSPPPQDLRYVRKHDSMICLKTVERRKNDPNYNVLAIHGQRTLHQC